MAIQTEDNPLYILTVVVKSTTTLMAASLFLYKGQQSISFSEASPVRLLMLNVGNLLPFLPPSHAGTSM